MTAQGFTAAELHTLARIEAAPEAPESLRERVAAAIWESNRFAAVPWAELFPTSPTRDDYRKMADAALVVIRPDQGDVR